MATSEPLWPLLMDVILKYSALPEHADDVPQLLAKLLPRYLTPALRQRYFELWQEHGFHVLPVSFYEPVPDTRTLGDDLWATRSALVGINMNEAGQLHLLLDVFPRFSDEYSQLPLEPTETSHEFYLTNGLFGGTDALALYCMVRSFRPHAIVEVGSGFSSLLSAQAALRNGNTTLTCIEPYPNDVLRAGFPGLTKLIVQKVQDVEVDLFTSLGPNDILFIDSSHVVRTGGDVNFLFLEVIPRLRSGVLVHIHDIFFPLEYRKDWVLDDLRFWNEQYLVQAFLSFNSAYEVLLCNSYLGYMHREHMQSTFPTSPWQGGGSLWLRRSGD